jgi:hypothetical protein
MVTVRRLVFLDRHYLHRSNTCGPVAIARAPRFRPRHLPECRQPFSVDFITELAARAAVQPTHAVEVTGTFLSFDHPPNYVAAA